MMSTDVFEIRLGQNVNMYTNRLGHLLITSGGFRGGRAGRAPPPP